MILLFRNLKLQPVVIRKMGDATEGFRLNDVEISGSNIDVTFSGIEGSSPASVDEVIIDTVSYDNLCMIHLYL